MNKPTIIERFADNGEHSHWELINSDTGEVLWSEGEKDCSTCAHYKETNGMGNSDIPSRECKAEAKAPYFTGKDLHWDYPVKNCCKYKRK